MATKAEALLDNISLRSIPEILPALSLAEQEQLLAELEHLQKMKTQKLAQEADCL